MRYVVAGLVAWVVISLAFAAGWATRARLVEMNRDLGDPDDSD